MHNKGKDTQEELEMTEEKKIEAIRQMIVHCEILQADYTPVSARSALRDLGYNDEELPEVLRFIADGGFDYCLDHTIEMTGHHEARGERPSYDVCYWGPDQLKSRLQSLSNTPRL
jgi:hypothetical protein